MSKACLIIMDGLGYSTCVQECGYLESAVEEGKARRWKMLSCLPTISAPLYETIHTGVSPQVHGILNNESLRASRCDNLFSVINASGRTAGVVAHSYFHTLYGGSQYDPFLHCEIDDVNEPIAYARYYSMDGYRVENACVPAEIDLCAQIWGLAKRHKPDYLLLHSCSIDTLGHWFTSDSTEYRVQAFKVDCALAILIPKLIDEGYHVLVTADHGMNTDGHHGGNQSILREVPFYYFGGHNAPAESDVLDQRAIAPSILSILNLAVPGSMTVSGIFS